MGRGVSDEDYVLHLAAVRRIPTRKAVSDGKIGDAVTPGAGNLETSSSLDVYTFSLADPQMVVFDGSNGIVTPAGDSSVVNVATGTSYGNIAGHHEYSLPPGDYKITVGGAGRGGTYNFTAYGIP